MVEIYGFTEAFDRSAFERFCKKYQLSFPAEYIDFLVKYNDGEFAANIIDGFDDCSVRYFYGTTSEAYSNLEDTYMCYLRRMPSSCVPIAELECGNLLCISIEQDSFGKIYLWDHEEMDIDENMHGPYGINEMQVVADSVPDLLSKIVKFSL